VFRTLTIAASASVFANSDFEIVKDIQAERDFHGSSAGPIISQYAKRVDKIQEKVVSIRKIYSLGTQTASCGVAA
jgi:hypothetical protein